jgi:hypothetical protein
MALYMATKKPAADPASVSINSIVKAKAGLIFVKGSASTLYFDTSEYVHALGARLF